MGILLGTLRSLNNLSVIYSTISSLFTASTPLKDNILMMLGIGTIGFYFYKVFYRFIWQDLEARFFPNNLIQKYGKGSWALITGASDGIGKAFCEELTRDGFNIILIARNKLKLENVVSQLRKIRPEVETKTIVLDFTNAAKPGFFEDVLGDIEDFDISLLVNNVGIETMDEFENISSDFLRDMIVVNSLPLVLLTKAVVQKMKNRKNGSGIINLSSLSAVRPLPLFTTYSATKRFTHIFSVALAEEVRKQKIDVLSVQPGYITTNMTAMKAESWDTTTVNVAARTFLNNLGKRDHTHGHIKHKLKEVFLSSWPECLYKKIVKKAIWSEMLRRREFHTRLGN